MLSDDDFRNQFEDHSLPDSNFDHIGHLRISWLYLQDFDVTEATNKVCMGIKGYAESLGAKDKFHHTLTEHTVKLIANRLNSQPTISFGEFLEANQDLVNNLKGIISQRYSDELLASPEARQTYCEPDLI